MKKNALYASYAKSDQKKIHFFLLERFNNLFLGQLHLTSVLMKTLLRRGIQNTFDTFNPNKKRETNTNLFF